MTTHNSHKSKLTAKQEAFCREYLIDLNATQAATRAGYSAKTADRIGAQLLGKTWVAERVQALKQERAQATQITAAYVLTTIVETIERCKQAEPVKNKEGEPTGEYKFDSGAVLKGAELLGKHLGIFTEKLKIQGDPDNPVYVAKIERVVVR